MSFIFNPSIATSNLTVLKNGVTIGTRPNINFIEGTQVAITAADDAPNSEVDVTIASTAGGAVASGSGTPGVISSFSEGSVFGEFMTSQGSVFNTTATVWPAANRAVYIPVIVPATITIYKMSVAVATTGGTTELGIYSEAGSKLVSLSATTGSAGLQVFDITDTTLSPDNYYLAMMCTSATAAFRGAIGSIPTNDSCGVRHESTGGTLPATATMVQTSTSAFVPAISAHFQGSVV